MKFFTQNKEFIIRAGFNFLFFGVVPAVTTYAGVTLENSRTPESDNNDKDKKRPRPYIVL